ncbi:methylmalonyl Co-A mutase-associated GTPase MeaB [Halobacteriales archaeon Cl-PHB]
MTQAERDELDDEVASLIDGILEGDQLSLSRLITRIENEAPGTKAAISRLHDHAPGTRTIGVTGQPGAGKSTMVDNLVDRYRERGLTVGVIAVDPSSPYSGGSVLGDRVRQTSRPADPGVFFRSMSARGHSGGLAAATFDVVHAMDAFGKDIIIIETVGAGQNEVDIVRAADTVCLVAIPGAGDDVQANKAGILEIADVFAVNKADLDGATTTAQELMQMIRIGQDLERDDEEVTPADDGGHHGGTGPEALQDRTPESDGWVPRVELTVATDGEGLADLIDALDDHHAYLEESGELADRRAQRFEQEVNVHLANEIAAVREQLVAQRVASIDDDADPRTVAADLAVPFRRLVEGADEAQ